MVSKHALVLAQRRGSTWGWPDFGPLALGAAPVPFFSHRLPADPATCIFCIAYQPTPRAASVSFSALLDSPARPSMAQPGAAGAAQSEGEWKNKLALPPKDTRIRTEVSIAQDGSGMRSTRRSCWEPRPELPSCACLAMRGARDLACLPRTPRASLGHAGGVQMLSSHPTLGIPLRSSCLSLLLHTAPWILHRGNQPARSGDLEALAGCCI